MGVRVQRLDRVGADSSPKVRERRHAARVGDTVPVRPACGPLRIVNVTVCSCDGGVVLLNRRRHGVGRTDRVLIVTGVRSMFEMNRRPSPRARMYGIPDDRRGRSSTPGRRHSRDRERQEVARESADRLVHRARQVRERRVGQADERGMRRDDVRVVEAADARRLEARPELVEHGDGREWGGVVVVAARARPSGRSCLPRRANVTVTVVSWAPPWVWWKTSSVPITTMFPSITGSRSCGSSCSCADVLRGAGGRRQDSGHRGSARRRTSNCAAVLSAHARGSRSQRCGRLRPQPELPGSTLRLSPSC